LKIRDFLSTDCIKLDLNKTEKEQHIREMVKLLESAGKLVKDKVNEIVKKVIDRENLGSTGIGHGIAMPHIKTEHVTSAVGALGISKKGIEFNSLDGEPVFVSFLLLTPDNDTTEHLLAISEISYFLKDNFYRDELRTAKNRNQVYNVIKKL